MTERKRLVIDAHQDLAWNMLTFGRDYTRSAHETRTLEKKSQAPQHVGDVLLGWEDYQRGRVAVVFATMFAAPIRKQEGDWDRVTYHDSDQAHSLYHKQMDAYHWLVDEHPDKFTLITDQVGLKAHLADWQDAPPWEEVSAKDPEETVKNTGLPVGLVPLMEGAEGIRHLEELPDWWARGLRIIGLAWAGSRFCGGTGEPGPLTSVGYELLEAMAELGFVLDLSHMDPYAAMQALEVYPGTVIASHANPLALVPRVESNRFLPDDLIDAIIQREGIIGAVLYNAFLEANWVAGMRRELVGIEKVAAVIDHICQFAGDAHHVGFGTDFDGGFGWQHVPHQIDTIADLHLLAPLLAEKGYSEDDLDAVFSKNWLTMLQSALPEGA